MKKVTKILSKTKDVLKNVSLHIYHYNEEGNEEISVIVDNQETAEEAAQELMGLLFDPGDKKTKETTEYRVKTLAWLPTLLLNIADTLKFILQEELANGIHEDMESLWKKIEAVENRVEKLEK